MISINGKVINLTNFPNGESCLSLPKRDELPKMVAVKLKFESNSDFINLMFVKKYLDELGIKVILSLSYMPYSRMDRVEEGSTFTLKYICEFINSLNFTSVMVHEPHSDVTPALLNNVRVINKTSKIVKEVLEIHDFKEENNDYIFFPDAGAEKRYSKQVTWKNQLTAIKKRDFKTGRIERLDVVGEVPKEPFRVIIMDDLCSKGGTFMMSATKLKELGATEIFLVVAHAEETMFDGDIFKTNLINRVYTTDALIRSIPSWVDKGKIAIERV